jgi:ABC-type spermidine/putrescine transport system permease subunit I
VERSVTRREHAHAQGAVPTPWLLAPGGVFLLLFFALPLLLLLRVSLYAGGSRSGFGIGALYQADTWSLQAYRGLFSDDYFVELLTFTLKFGAQVALISVLLGLALALLIQRLRPGLRAWALGAVFLPKLASVLVVIYGLELLLGSQGLPHRVVVALSGSDAVSLLHNFSGALIGEVYLVLPYAVLLLVAALDRIDPLLRPAARGLGAGPLRCFVWVTLPLVWPSLGATFLLCLVFGMGAYVAPYILGSPNEFTLSIDIQRQAFEYSNWPRAAAESMLLLVALGVVAAVYSAGSGWWRVRGRA